MAFHLGKDMLPHEIHRFTIGLNLTERWSKIISYQLQLGKVRNQKGIGKDDPPTNFSSGIPFENSPRSSSGDGRWVESSSTGVVVELVIGGKKGGKCGKRKVHFPFGKKKKNLTSREVW